MVLERNLINDELHSALSIVQSTMQVIPADIIVSKKFNIHRSFRRGATMRAKEQGVDEAKIELIGGGRFRIVREAYQTSRCRSFMLKFRKL